MAGKVKLTPTMVRILRALNDRAMDTLDLADHLGLREPEIFKPCVQLRDAGYLDWMYAEDQASTSKAGRAALSQQTGSGETGNE